MKSSTARTENWFLGDLEPISQSRRDSTPDRRQISFRWLSGSILAGVTSLFLMGGALFAAFDGRQQFTVPASSFLSDQHLSSRSSNGIEASKGNRVGLERRTIDETSNIMMVPTIKRVNDRDVVKVRPFMVLKAPLAIAPLRKVTYPEFNPLAVFSDSGDSELISKSSDSIYGAEVESEVSIKVTTFPYENSQIVLASRQRTIDIEEFVRRAGPGLEGNANTVASSSNIDPNRFSKSGDEPLITPGVIITAENVSVKNKIHPEDFIGARYEDRIIRVRADSTLATILKAEGMEEPDAREVEKILSADLGNQGLGRGDSIRLAYRVSPQSVSISRISLYRGASHIVSIARSDENRFIYSQEPARPPQLATGVKRQQTVSRARLPSAYDGINRAALSEGLTDDLTKILVRIFAFDIDFRNKITPSDELTAFVSLEEGQVAPGNNSEILFTSIKLDKTTRKYYRFRDSATGHVDYYDETGKSAKKFLLRKPVPNAQYRSGFGFRRHPISRARKMHWGADWAAPRGTPIIAAGNGIVVKSGWSGGYGKQTVIQHANGYKTSYSHQTAIAKGITAGKRVRQGQIIGYVGTTGYSTGPHLHYEVVVNGNKVDPMRIRLPKGKILKGEELLLFEAERDRIDILLQKRENDATRLALN
ncbi:MAG: M23 family metallopeptidase [Hyphomicrobiales bacterium]|nr:M23 family metallopeptidase [Hyphomicrobiales bacterium]